MRGKQDIFKKAKEVSKVLNCLSSPTRLMIVCILIDGEKNGSEILEKIGTTKGNISQHLGVLMENELLENRRDGNRIFYSIKDKRIIKIVSGIRKLYCPNFKF